MSLLDINLIVAGLSADAPCGENLEYDPAYLELEQAAEEKPETQYGDTIVAALPPDWKQVKRLSLALLQRSLDLRIATLLTRACLQVDGLQGFADGLSVVAALLQHQWQQLHPQLDPDDDNDPMLRVNTLASLIDPVNVLQPLRTTPIVVSRAQGRFCLRDIEVALGEVEPLGGAERPSLAIIDGAFVDVGQEQTNATWQALQQAISAIESIENQLTSYVGAASALDMSALAKMLRRARDFVLERLQRLGGGATGTETPGAPPADGTVTAVVASALHPDEIRSREDVVRSLERLCEYYRRNEPSSPVPLLLQRAQRLAGMSFIEIMQELAPEGMNQILQVSGTQNQ